MHVLLFACICVLQIITKSSSAEGSSRRRLGNTSTCPHMRFDITKLASAASCSWRWLCYMLKRALWASAYVAKRTSSVSCSWWWLCYSLSIKYWKYFFFFLTTRLSMFSFILSLFYLQKHISGSHKFNFH